MLSSRGLFRSCLPACCHWCRDTSPCFRASASSNLRAGQPARNSLFASSLAFVSGFSVVFISFGASASAVGQFLLQHKALMGPVAGAVIILFGLHLVGWLIKLPVNAGIVIGGVLAFGAAILWRRVGD